ncbi:MAG TPA: metalloregulator ArsR/SmtB family transcription factor [Phenylobacterium sp.]|uniref:ArsR/SmtB family transcription factor n=1 Tax=Phenylobacterium sp. TaxID=1871053 RepID=UPI002B8E82D3|nr:metalloregulator ArsR/SmtB family transcription factor [Phenylobacterium sp.]HSV04170.1 metalloregulator ArsR/SmtB family transcription factor [Phenylobacterium sp.]
MPASDVFRVLADPTRRSLFERLAEEGELSVAALTRGAGVSQPAVSQHLAALRGAGLVAEQRAGRSTLYRVDPQGLRPLVDWLGHYAVFWRDRFDALEDLLKRMDP